MKPCNVYINTDNGDIITTIRTCVHICCTLVYLLVYTSTTI